MHPYGIDHFLSGVYLVLVCIKINEFFVSYAFFKMRRSLAFNRQSFLFDSIDQ